MRRLTLLIFATLVVLPCRTGAQKVPQGAVDAGKKAFQIEIERLRSKPESFRHSWNLPDYLEETSTLVLEDPYVEFMMLEDEVVDFANSNGLDIVSFGRAYSYGFAMTSNGRHIGTILVMHNMDGNGRKRVEDKPEWVTGARRSAGDWLFERITELRREYPVDQGFVISALRTYGVGNYLVVRQKGVTMRITPGDRVAAKTLRQEGRLDRGDYPVIDYGEALPLLREQAVEQARWLEQRRNQVQPDSGGQR